ncbi:hypothetical protein M3612_19525 [Niallia taxi]|uniref:hypothetical protein n=1 Tax=Niallia taxi TaxID=2499688 RepID=UPI00203B5359|nr:hypothetical protein [Niallia taxi]MCM3216681.1 hypothetical protein [Niallia taxi]
MRKNKLFIGLFLIVILVGGSFSFNTYKKVNSFSDPVWPLSTYSELALDPVWPSSTYSELALDPVWPSNISNKVNKS